MIEVRKFLEELKNDNCNWVVWLLQEATSVNACGEEQRLISVGLLKYLTSDTRMVHRIVESQIQIESIFIATDSSQSARMQINPTFIMIDADAFVNLNITAS